MRHTCEARMRTMHDAILVGIGTALNDDPQLNSMSPRLDDEVKLNKMAYSTPRSYVT